MYYLNLVMADINSDPYRFSRLETSRAEFVVAAPPKANSARRHNLKKEPSQESVSSSEESVSLGSVRSYTLSSISINSSDDSFSNFNYEMNLEIQFIQDEYGRRQSL